MAVIFMELARRLALPVAGLGIPRHFIVQYRSLGGQSRLLDVFGGCRTLGLEDLRELSGLPLVEGDRRPATKRELIARMLQNLAAVAEIEQDVPALLGYADAILLLDENAAGERLRRAFLRARTGQPAAAAEDLDWLLERQPENLDLKEAQRLREALRREGF